VIVFAGHRAKRAKLGELLTDSRPGLEVHLIGDGATQQPRRGAVADGTRAGNAV